MIETEKSISKNMDSLIGSLPFKGQWIVGYTPAKKVPSHGTNLFGTSYAIDFMAVDHKNRTSPSKSWRRFLGVESPESFYSFGKSVLSPIDGKVVNIHNGEEDHVARRNLFTLLPYALGQAARIRMGYQAIAGNYVVIKSKETDIFVVVVHLQKNSILVNEGQVVSEGQHIANCGNSGNSTEPHIHIQAMDSIHFSSAKGVPLYFNHFTQRKGRNIKTIKNDFPDYGSVISENNKFNEYD